MQELSYERRKQALIEEITAAFDGVAREDGVTLHEAEVIDGGGNPERRAEARKKDREKRWQDVPEEVIGRADSQLSFLDSKGFHYYLPAHLVWYLRNIDKDDPQFWSNTFDSLLYHLGSSEILSDGSCLSRFRLLTQQQSKAVAQFLVFVAEQAKWSVEELEQRQTTARKAGMSELEIKSIVEEAERVEHKNAQQALERYWKRFL